MVDFSSPRARRTLPAAVVRVPGTLRADRCLLVDAALWTMFRDASLWVEALCIYEWSLCTERVTQGTTRAVGGVARRTLCSPSTPPAVDR